MKISDIDPFSLPSALLQNRAYLPNRGGVYFVIERALILYIGQTNNLQKRWRSHHRFPQLDGKKEVLISWLECPENERFELERDLIRLHSPLLNREKMPSSLNQITIDVSDSSLKAIQSMCGSEKHSFNRLVSMMLELGISEYVDRCIKAEPYLKLLRMRKLKLGEVD